MKHLPSLACVAFVACLLLWHGYSPLLSIAGSVATLAVFSSHLLLHPFIEKLAARSTSRPGWSHAVYYGISIPGFIWFLNTYPDAGLLATVIVMGAFMSSGHIIAQIFFGVPTAKC